MGFYRWFCVLNLRWLAVVSKTMETMRGFNFFLGKNYSGCFPGPPIHSKSLIWVQNLPPINWTLGILWKTGILENPPCRGRNFFQFRKQKSTRFGGIFLPGTPKILCSNQLEDIVMAFSFRFSHTRTQNCCNFHSIFSQKFREEKDHQNEILPLSRSQFYNSMRVSKRGH